jgi:HlyD family secretion protein
MKRTVIIILIVLAALIAIGVSWHYISKKHQNKDELYLYGNVDVRQVDIGFRVAGRVAELFFEEGDYVPQGTLMALLDKSPYDSKVNEAIANVESTKANLVNAEILLKRRLELIGIGGVSQEDVDNAKATRDEQLGHLYAAEAALAVALDNMAYTEVRAPTDGIILTRIREPGTVVNPADPVYTLSVCSPVWIRAFVPEPNLGQIYYGMTAEIYTDTEDGPVYTGKIGFISPVAEFTPKTVETTQLRTDLVYRLRIYADNPDRYLKQGMPVTVKLHIDHSKARRKGE